MKIIERKISELKPAEYNPRQLTDKQYKDIKESLERFGFVDPVIVNTLGDRKNIIIGGHQRVKVWEALGNTTVPTVEVSLELKAEQELNVRLNKNTGGWDFDILANLFEKDDLIEWGFENFELGLGGDADSDMSITNSEETGLGDTIDYLKFGDVKVPLTTEELTLITDSYDKYREANGTVFGYINNLLG